MMHMFYKDKINYYYNVHKHLLLKAIHLNFVKFLD